MEYSSTNIENAESSIASLSSSSQRHLESLLCGPCNNYPSQEHDDHNDSPSKQRSPNTALIDLVNKIDIEQDC